MELCTDQTKSKEKRIFTCRDQVDGKTAYCSIKGQVGLEKRKQQRSAWEASFANDPINLRDLPKNVVLKARQIIQGLACQRNYREFHGKRLRHDRFIFRRAYANCLLRSTIANHLNIR